VDELTHSRHTGVRPIQKGHGREPPAQGLDQRGIALVAVGRQCLLEILDEAAAVVGVLFGPANDLVEAEAGEGQFLGGADPTLGSGRQHPQQLREAGFIWGTHVH
jgi:hypothetical protein